MSLTPEIAVDPRLLAVLRALFARRPGRILLERAEVELVRLLLREQAALLRCAARLRRAAQARAVAPREAARGDTVRGDTARRAARWRRAAGECAALCAADELPFARLLAVCLAEPVSSWPSPEALERGAQRRRPRPTS
jgi:hypothetical protein